MFSSNFTRAQMRRHFHFNLARVNSDVANRTVLQVAKNIANECDVGSDGVLHHRELLTCWQLASTEEYVLYSILHDNSATLDVYGACGNMYAVEYAAPQPFLGYQTSFSDDRSWAFRTRLAVALLDMVEALEDTVFGTLYLCDVQESNFGVVSYL